MNIDTQTNILFHKEENNTASTSLNNNKEADIDIFSANTKPYKALPPNVADYRESNSIFHFFTNLFNRPEWQITKEKGKTVVGNNKGQFWVVDSYNDPDYDINGKIDMDIHQGYNMRDCTAIAICSSMAQSEKGAQILQDAISTNYNDKGEIESYSVYFKGFDETYTITKEEIDEALDKQIEFIMGESEYTYSSGDKDMLLLELAFSKHILNSNDSDLNPNTETILQSLENNGGLIFEGLTGCKYTYNLCPDAQKYEDDTRKKIEEEIKQSATEYLENNKTFKLSDLTQYESDGIICGDGKGGVRYEINSEDEYEVEEMSDGKIRYKNKRTNESYECFLCDICSFLASDVAQQKEIKQDIFDIEYEFMKNADVVEIGATPAITVNDIEGNSQTITMGHAYGVIAIDDETITIINPWDTATQMVIPKEELRNEADKISFSYGIIEK